MGTKIMNTSKTNMAIPKMLETYLDGLDAFGDGRGFDHKHETARQYVEDAVRYATIRRDALQRIADWPVSGNSWKCDDIANALDAIKDLARAALKS